MADVNANIGVNLDASSALAQLKALQKQITAFHTSVSKSSEAASLAQRDLQRRFLDGVNSIGAFSAELRTVRTTAESFTNSLEKNKFSMREYFRYSMGATRSFGKFFRTEFDTINKVALENVKNLSTQYIKMGRDASGAMQAIAIRPVTLDLENYTTKTQIAAQRQALLNQLIKQGSTNLLNFGKNTQWAGRQLMVGFTLPLASLGSVAAKTFMEMETAAIKFKKVYGDLFTPVNETEAALANIKELGLIFTRYGIAVSDTVSLAAEAAAAGFKGLDLQRQVTEATRLQVLGQIDAQKALQTTISLQSAFKMSSSDLADTVNFLNAVENQTVVSLDDITTAIPKVGPIVRQLGGDVKDLAYFMAAMKENGVQAGEGANALKTGLSRLISPTNKAKALFKSMGVDLEEIVTKNAGNLRGTLEAVSAELKSFSGIARQRAIKELFGIQQQSRLTGLFEGLLTEGNQASRVLDLASASTEDLAATAEKELGITADSAMNKFRGSVEQLKVSLAPIGKLFLEIITPFVKNITSLIDRFNELSPAAKKVIGTLVVGLGGIAPIVLMTIGLFANFVANGIKGLNILRNGYLRLTGQSQLLGEQTNYLTIEQQNALTAASSLDQIHSKLKQTFNVEADALAALVFQYQRLITAQKNAFTAMPDILMPVGRKGAVPKRLSSGTTGVTGGVPGKDSVFSLLTPGEAVVPEPIAQDKRFKPIISALVSGKIAKYNGGTTGASIEDMSRNKSMFFDFDDTLVDTKTEFKKWKAQKGIVGGLDADLYSDFSKDVIDGKVKIPGINNNLRKMKSAIAAGIDTRILSARVDDALNRELISKVLSDNGISLSNDKVHLQPISSFEKAVSKKTKPEKRDAFFKRDFLKSFTKTGKRALLVDDNIQNLRSVDRANKNISAIFSKKAKKEASYTRNKNGTYSVNFGGKSYVVPSRDTAIKLPKLINAYLTNPEALPGERLKSLENASLEEKQKHLRNRIISRLDEKSGKNQNITIDEVFKHMDNPVEGTGSKSNPKVESTRSFLSRKMEEKNKKLLDNEVKTLRSNLIKSGFSIAGADDFLQKQESHIGKAISAEKKWTEGLVAEDYKGLNNYLNRAKGIDVGNAVNNTKLLKQLGYSDSRIRLLKESYAFAKAGSHPTSKKQLSMIANLAKLELDLVNSGLASKEMKKQVHQAKGVLALADVRFGIKDYYKDFGKRIIRLGGTLEEPTAAPYDEVLASEREAIATKGKKTLIPVTKVGKSKKPNEISVPSNREDNIKVKLDHKTQEIVEPIPAISKFKGAKNKNRYLPGKADAPYVQTESGLLVPSSATESFDDLSKAVNDSTENIKDNNKITGQTEGKFNKLNRRLSTASFAMMGVAGGLSLFGVELGGATEKLFTLSTGLFALQTGMMVFGKQGLGGLILKFANKIKVASATVAASAGAKSGLAKVGSIALTVWKNFTPWGRALTIGTAALGLLTAGFLKHNKTREEERKSIEGLGNAARITGDKLKAVGSYFGFAPRKSAIEAAKESGTNTAGVPGQVLSVISDFVNSSEFKNFEDDVATLRSATSEQAKLLLEGLSLQLIAKGASKQQVAIIVESLKQQAQKTDVKIDFNTIDISTEEGLNNLSKNITSVFDNLSKSISSKIKNNIATSTNFVAKYSLAMFETLQLQLEDGVISLDQYGKSVGEIVTKLNAIKDTAVKTNVLNTIFKEMGTEVEATAGKITNLSGKMLYLQAAMVGITALSPQLVKGLSGELVFPFKDAASSFNWAKESITLLIDEAAKSMPELKKMWDTLLGKNIPSGGGGKDKEISAQAKKVVEALKKKVKGLEEERDRLKEVNDEIDRQYEYQQRQQELESDIVQAKISGNYIQAALLSQQKLFETAQFNRETQYNKLESRIDKINERIDEIEGGAKLTDAEKRLDGISKKTGAGGSTTPKPTSKTTSSSSVVTDPTKTTSKTGGDAAPHYLGLNAKGGTPQIGKRTIPAPPAVPQQTSKEYYFNTKTGKWDLLTRTSTPSAGYVTRQQWMKGTKTYAMGGYVTGPGTTLSDSIPALLSNKEFVWSASAVKNAGGPAAVGAMHQYFKNNSGDSKKPSSSSSIVNNNNIYVSGNNPDEIAKRVMVELDRIAKKNNKGNRVIS